MSADLARGAQRRAVLKGAAWSAPVIALAVAAPAASASERCDSSNPQLTGVGTWHATYPGGASRTLPRNTSVTFVYRLTLGSIGIQNSWGDLGFQNIEANPGSRVLAVSCDTPNVSVARQTDPWYENNYFRYRFTADLPKDTVITFTITLRTGSVRTVGTDDMFTMDAWYLSQNRNRTCAILNQPAYQAVPPSYNGYSAFYNPQPGNSYNDPALPFYVS